MDSTETTETIKLATLLSTTFEQEMIVFKIKDLYNSVISQNQSVGQQTLQKMSKACWSYCLKRKGEKIANFQDDEPHLPACNRSYWITCYQ